MSSAATNPLFSSLDNIPNKQLGENGHVEYSWSHKPEELLTQIYFQLVRAKSQSETLDIRNKVDEVLQYSKREMSHDSPDYKTYQRVLINLYKMVGHTRDIEYKGERQLAYAQVWVWYKYYPELAFHLVRSFVHYIEDDDSNNSSKHQYGSWNDIKYMCDAVKVLNNNDEHHPLIDYAVTLLVEQLQKDIRTPDGNPISLAARHSPREKSSRYGWVFKRVAREMFPYRSTAVTSSSATEADKKSWMNLRKEVLSPLNRRLDTPQIKMAHGKKGEGRWDEIDFNTITSKTMRLYSKAWQNKTKTGDVRTCEDHRVACANNFTQHISAAVSGDVTKKVRGKRCNTYELVKDASEARDPACLGSATIETDRINLQWASNSENNKGLGNMIAIADVSGSMTVDNSIPLYNAVGLALRISEKASPAFRDRVLTFSSSPTWINLSDCKTFCEKVAKVSESTWSMTTDLHKAFRLILDGILESNMAPVDVENMILCVFSDMQFKSGSCHSDFDTMHKEVQKMFSTAGLESKYNKPYSVPHLVWWNLRMTTGFPTLSSTKNCSMLSGYNASLLNTFESKGVEALKDYTPCKMIYDILDEERYNMLDRKFTDIVL